MNQGEPWAAAGDLATAFSAMEEGVLITDVATQRILFSNEAAARLTGFDSARALMEAPSDELATRFVFIDEQGRPLRPELLPHVRALRGEDPPPEDLRFRIQRTGEEHWARVSAIPLRDESGCVRQVINLFRRTTRQRRAEWSLRFLAEASATLNASLDYHATLRSLARLAVPGLADGCLAHVLESEGGFDCVSSHVDPAREAALRRLGERYPPRLDARAGLVSHLRADIPAADDAPAARDEEHRQLLLELGYRQGITVPLEARGRVLGTLSLVLTEKGRDFDEADVALATELAGRAALAIDNARLYSEAQAALQKARAAEARSRASEERLLMTLRAGRMGYFDLDRTTQRLTASPEMEALLGFAPGTYDGTVPAALARLHPEDRAWAAERLDPARAPPAPGQPVHIRVLDPNGAVRWIEFHTRTFQGEAGQVVRTLGVAQDVTERQVAAERSRQLELEQVARAAEARRASHEALRADVSAALAGRGTLAATLQVCAAAMVEHLRVALASIWTIDHEEHALRLLARAGGTGPASRLPLDHPPWGRSSGTGSPSSPTTCAAAASSPASGSSATASPPSPGTRCASATRCSAPSASSPTRRSRRWRSRCSPRSRT